MNGSLLRNEGSSLALFSNFYQRLRFVYDIRFAREGVRNYFEEEARVIPFIFYPNQMPFCRDHVLVMLVAAKIKVGARATWRREKYIIGLEFEFGGIIEWCQWGIPAIRNGDKGRIEWSEYNVLVLKTTQCHRARKYAPGDARHSRKSVVLKIPAKRKSSIQQLFQPQSSRSIYSNFPQTVEREFFPRYSRNSIQLPYTYIYIYVHIG